MKGFKKMAALSTRSFSSYDNIIQMDELQKSMKDMARDFSKAEIEPFAEKIDREDHMDISLWRKMGDQGFLGITAPEEYGG